MDSTTSTLKRRRGEACLPCRNTRRKCRYKDDETCAPCAESGRKCSQGTGMPSRRNGKRKSEDLESISDCNTYQIDRATSSITVSQYPEDMPNIRAQRNTRSVIRTQSESAQPLQPNPAKEENNSFCSICKRKPSLRKRVWEKDMVQCDIDTCGRWYHFACLWYDKKQHILVQRETGQDNPNNLFICSICNEKPEARISSCVAEADAVATNMIVKVKWRLASTEDDETEIPDSPANEILSPEVGRREELIINTPWETHGALGFVPARQEKYNGFEEKVVYDLFRKINQSIFNYNKEVCDIVEVFGASDDESTHYPLKAWNLVDPSVALVPGQKWYRCEGNGHFNHHAPITASLRNMMQATGGEPMNIPSRLHGLTFSQVHTSFVYWFVIDVLANEFDIFRLANMKPVRAMMAGVYNFGEERWPQMGKHVLREVQLRTWHKDMFRGEMLQNKDHLMRRMELFMEPLTKSFKQQWSLHRNDVIEYTIQLWSYFDALGGMFGVIEPKLGSTFDSELHEGFDEEGMPYIVEKHSKKTILWVTRRGFRYREHSIDGPRELLVKAIVIVR